MKLLIANLKMLSRNKQLLFWSLAFPLIFTAIFCLFFGFSLIIEISRSPYMVRARVRGMGVAVIDNRCGT